MTSVVTDFITGAMNATETTEEKIDSITFDVNALRIVGIGVIITSAGFTADEVISGYIRISGKNIKNDNYVPIPMFGEATPEMNIAPRDIIVPVDIPIDPNTTVDFYVKNLMVLTVTPTVGIFVSYEIN